jgi:hypothetical protein
MARLDLQERQIARRIRAGKLRLEGPPLARLHCDVVGAIHDVMIGHDVAVGVNDDSRSECVLNDQQARLRRAAVSISEQIAKETNR